MCRFSSSNETGYVIRHKKGVRIVSCSILKSGLRITYSTDKTIAPHRYCYIICHSRQGISNRCRCYCQPYLRGISNLRSLTLEDKISITPFVIRCDSLLPTLWVCESSAKLLKNVIGGAMLDNVFQHKAGCFVKPCFPKPHKKEREHPHSLCKCPLCQLD